MLERCGSLAEAYFLRRLFETDAKVYDGGRVAHCRGVSVWVQQPCGPYRIDVVAQSGRTQLAIEIDGMQHWSSRGKVLADNRRERFLLRAGFVVLRFAASEVMAHLRDAAHVIVGCNSCGKGWSLNIVRGGRLPRGWWKYPNRCNQADE